MSDRALIRAALACLVVGAVLLVVFDQWLAQLFGVLLLIAFVVLGTFGIASPANLSGDDRDRGG